MYYKHVDVFSKQRFSGNSLTVFFPEQSVSNQLMQLITKEMRHFESIFLYPLDSLHNTEFEARIFTLEEELDFAGHPVIGAASAIHDKFFPTLDKANLRIKLKAKTVEVESRKSYGYYTASMEQRIPEFIAEVPQLFVSELLSAFNLNHHNLAQLPLEVVSTGLNYLIVPLISGLDQIRHRNISDLLYKIDAKFVYFYDLYRCEGRSWDNEGIVEDVATGSAAGPVAAYLVKHHICKFGQMITIKQGSYLERPSLMHVIVSGYLDKITGIKVIGDTCMVGEGKIKGI